MTAVAVIPCNTNVHGITVILTIQTVIPQNFYCSRGKPRFYRVPIAVYHFTAFFACCKRNTRLTLLNGCRLGKIICCSSQRWRRSSSSASRPRLRSRHCSASFTLLSSKSRYVRPRPRGFITSAKGLRFHFVLFCLFVCSWKFLPPPASRLSRSLGNGAWAQKL